MKMHVATFAFAALALAACDDPKKTPALPPPPPPPSATEPTAAPTAAEPIPSASTTASTTSPEPPVAAGSRAAKEGEMCGGFAGIPCEKGLVCANVMPVADGAGTCRKGKK